MYADHPHLMRDQYFSVDFRRKSISFHNQLVLFLIAEGRYISIITEISIDFLW